MKELLLLHGALGSQEQFDELKNALKDDYKIHSINFSGHGRVPSHHHAYTIQNFAHEVLDWMNQKFIQTIDIFGYSMGGYVALWLARFYPERVGRVYTLGTKLRWNEEEAQKEIKMLNADKIAEKVPAFATALANRHGEHEWKSVLAKTALMMYDLGHTHLTDQDFIKIEHTLILGLGSKDNMVSHQETDYCRHLIKNSQLRILEEMPHAIEQIPVEILKQEILLFFR